MDQDTAEKQLETEETEATHNNNNNTTPNKETTNDKYKTKKKDNNSEKIVENKKEKEKIKKRNQHKEKKEGIDNNKKGKVNESNKITDNKTNGDKTKIVARNLLRLYQFIQDGKPIKQKDLIRELEMDTPNEELNNKIEQLELELDSVYDENRALREAALQSQIQFEDEIQAYELENQSLKNKLAKIDQVIKAEFEKRVMKYEGIIADLKKELRDALQKNETITEVNDRIEQLEEQLSKLFDENDRLNVEVKRLRTENSEANLELAILHDQKAKLDKKVAELTKKVELQQMVIDGYKRRLEE